MDRSEAEIAKAARFSAFQEEFKEVFGNIRRGLDNQMDTIPMVNVEMHSKLILTRQLLNNLEKYVQTTIDTGKLAEFYVQQQEQKQNWLKSLYSNIGR